MHVMSNSDLIHEEKETTRKSKESFKIIGAYGSITTTEEVTVFVSDLDMLSCSSIIGSRTVVLADSFGRPRARSGFSRLRKDWYKENLRAVLLKQFPIHLLRKFQRGTSKNLEGNIRAATNQLKKPAEIFYWMCLERGERLERRPYASAQTQNIPNQTATHRFHTRHAMYIASLSFDGSSFWKHTVSMAVDILHFIQRWYEFKEFGRVMAPWLNLSRTSG